MARNGSGTYTKVNTFVAGNSITAAGHNQNWDDIATEITNSVAADGQTTLTGPLKAASGTVGAPGVTFASDTDCGLYRIGGNNIGVAVNGAKVLDVATTGLAVTGTLSATTSVDAPSVKQGGIALLPVGVILPYGGAAAPSGYLLCYGQQVSQTTYADLYAALGPDAYGADGGGNFYLPDLRGRVVAGQDDMGGSSANRLTNANDGLNGDTLGATGGGETQTLVTGNLPAYTPAGSVAAPTITTSGNAVLAVANGSGTQLLAAGANTNVYASSTFGAVSASAPAFTGTAQGGNSDAFGVVQPTIILNYIIFAGV
jgi:microcystin-dependent protein